MGNTNRELAVPHLSRVRPRHLAPTRCPRNDGVLEEGLTAAEAGSFRAVDAEASMRCPVAAAAGRPYSTIDSPPLDAFMMDYALPEPSLSWRGAFGTRQGSGYRTSW